MEGSVRVASGSSVRIGKGGGGRCLVSGTLVAYVAGAGHIIRVEFRVADVVEDVYGECAEAGSTLFLNLKVGARFRGPVDEEFPDGAEASGAFVA